MPAPLYTRMAGTSKNLLAKYGKSFTLKRNDPGTYDPATLSNSGGSTTSYTVTGQIFTYNEKRVAASGGLIKAGDRELVIALKGLSITVNPNTDLVTVDGIDWRVVNVTKPVDENVIAYLQLRQLSEASA